MKDKKDNPEFKKLVKKASKQMNAVKSAGVEPAEPKTVDGELLTLEYSWATNLHPAQFLWIFELFNDNMMELYKRSDWGYEENSKKQELQATTARYIIVKNSKKKHVGYVHYRFDIENGLPVVYCYELQVIKDYQKKGIGSLLINLLVDLAKKTGMQKVMATVFIFNGNSLAFFHKNGFRLDDTTPPKTQEIDYVILSRWVAPGKEQQPVGSVRNELEDLILQQIRAAKICDENTSNDDGPSESRILKASAAAKVPSTATADVVTVEDTQNAGN